MPELKSLATIIEFSDRTSKKTTFRFGSVRLEPYGNQEWGEAWQASLLSPDGEFILGNGMESLELACESLIMMCHTKKYDLSDDSTVNEIPNNREISSLLLHLQPNLSNISASLQIDYMPAREYFESHWTGNINLGNKWQSYALAKASDQSLYKVCLELWEEFQNIS